MKKSLVSYLALPAIILIWASSSPAQQPKKRSVPKPAVIVTEPETAPVGKTTGDREDNPLTNADIIRMSKAGFEESIIINHIQSNKSKFNVSINSLFELKNAGVSQKIIETMQSAATGKQTTSPIEEQDKTTPAKNPASENPLSKQSQTTDASAMSMMGVVLIDGSKRVEMKLTQTNTRSNGIGAMVPIFGKSKFKSALNGNQAQLRISDTTPEFEIALSSNLNPTDQLVLVKVYQKSDRREIEVGRVTLVGGMSTGFRKEAIVPTTFKEIKTQTIGGGLKYIIYRVTVVNPLPPGEYVFASQSVYYDFGIDSGSENLSSTADQNSQTSPLNSEKSDAGNNDKSAGNVSSNVEIPEITIDADIDKVRGAILRHLIQDKFNLIKDEPSRLVFSKEVGGAGGFLGGVLLSNNGKNPRKIKTFIITKTQNGTLVIAQLGVMNPDRNGQGDVLNVGDKKTKQSLLKDLMDIKDKAEN